MADDAAAPAAAPDAEATAAAKAELRLEAAAAAAAVVVGTTPVTALDLAPQVSESDRANGTALAFVPASGLRSTASMPAR